MQGEFIQKRFSKLLFWLFFVLGTFSSCLMILLFLFLENKSSDFYFLGSFIFTFGFSSVFYACVSRYFERRVYIRMTEDEITAFCHLGGHLRCHFYDVADAWILANVLRIRLKSGKEYQLNGLENIVEVYEYIQKRCSINKEDHSSGKIKKRFYEEKRKKTRYLIIALFSLSMGFGSIFATAALTGWKEDLWTFLPQEWVVFWFGMGALVLFFCVFVFFLFKCVRKVHEVQRLRNAFLRSILRNTPLQPGNAKKIFADSEYNLSARVVLYGFPDSEQLYFTIEHINSADCLCLTYRSKVYSDMNDLTSDFPDILLLPEIKTL